MALNSASAYAQEEQGAYFGGNFGFAALDTGTAEQQIANELVAFGFASANATIDDSTTGFKILVGYQVNRNFAVEGYYANLGSYDLAVGTTGPSASASGEIEITGIGFDLIGMHPFGSTVSGFARVGLFMGELDVTLTGPAGTGRGSDDGTDLKFGLGLQWKLTERVRLRGEWEYYNFDDAVSLLSFGVLYRFQ